MILAIKAASRLPDTSRLINHSDAVFQVVIEPRLPFVSIFICVSPEAHEAAIVEGATYGDQITSVIDDLLLTRRQQAQIEECLVVWFSDIPDVSSCLAAVYRGCAWSLIGWRVDCRGGHDGSSWFFFLFGFTF